MNRYTHGWHGLILPPEVDGVPKGSGGGIQPGEVFTYRFSVRQIGTYRAGRHCSACTAHQTDGTRVTLTKEGRTCMRSTLFSTLVIIGFTLGLASTSFGTDQNPATPSAAKPGTVSSKITPELKQDMADMYQKMAACMRTEKSVEQCRQEAMQNCPVVEKTGHCPINEGMSSMRGKRMKRSTK